MAGWILRSRPRQRAVNLMGLKYVVLTSVNRDDLADGGASHYAAVVQATKALNPDTAVEALTQIFWVSCRRLRLCWTPASKCLLKTWKPSNV